MKKFLVRSSVAAFATLVLALSGCGGGGGGGSDSGGDTPPATLAQSLTTASTQASNDTAANPTASFTVLQSAGVPVVTVNSPPKVNFAVFSDGALKKDLKLTNVSFTLAKLVPGAGGEPDQWVSYIYRKETAAAGFGPGGAATPAATAMQATADPKQTDTALAAAQLVYNADGYYTYTFRANITDPAWTATANSIPYSTNGVAYEPNRTHRVSIQLSYVNAAGQTVRVNPYFDFTLDASGRSVPVTNASLTRKVVDIATCNNCHNKLALHGGGRVDTQYCVTCHNPGTKDANSGNVLTMSTMVHKIHAGRMLHEKGENYVIWGNSNSKHDYSEVGFPQPIRNCVACHEENSAKTPQGANWKSAPNKDACLSCHQSGSTSAFFAKHVTELKLGADVASIPNSTCTNCHAAGGQLGADSVHWVQEMANTENYQAKIVSVKIKQAATSTASGTMTVKVSVINPKTGTAYDLREGCGYTWTALRTNGVLTGWRKDLTTTDSAGNTITGCKSDYRWDAQTAANAALKTEPADKFGQFAVYLATETLAGLTVDDATNTSNMAAYRGVDDGSRQYSVDLQIPAGAKGNARVMLVGAVAERRIDPVTRAATGAVPPTSNADLAYVPVKNAIMDVNVATGSASSTPRRAIVANDNCNSCHGFLGAPMANQTMGFHKGVRNNADGCAVCHNANQAGGYTLMADASITPLSVSGDSQLAAGNTSKALHESYQAKRFVHGIHYGAKRNYPFTHCMNVAGEYNKDGTNKVSTSPSLGASTCVDQYPEATLNFTAEVAYPGSLTACANCHVNDSWKQDKSVLGSVVFKPTGVSNSLDWLVMSPRVATCTTCHDSKAVQTHVKNVGGAFGDFSQRDLLLNGKVFESCDGCHAAGSALGLDVAHRLR